MSLFKQVVTLNKGRRLISKPRLSICWRCRRSYMKMHLQTFRKHSLTRSSSIMQNNAHTKLKIGDKVLVEFKKNDRRKSGKLEINFKGGPYTITEDMGKGRFHLKDAQGKILKTAINCHRLKIWHDPQAAKLNQLSVSISFLVCLFMCIKFII